MIMHNRFTKILKDQTGASLVFILGIMLLLMAIGVSALVAASANTSYVLKQKEHSEIMILDESIHKNIMYSLQYNPADINFLSAQLVMAAYNAYDTNNTSNQSYTLSELKEGITLDINIEDSNILNSGNIKVEKITLSFTEIIVSITDPIPAIYTPAEYDEEGVEISPKVLDCPREPKTASLDMTMIVTVELNSNGKIVTSRAIYEYNNGKLSDDPDVNGLLHFDDETSGNFFEMAFTSDGYGEWRLIKYENIDSKDSTDSEN